MAVTVQRRPYPPSVLSRIPIEGKPAPKAEKPPAKKAAAKKAAKKAKPKGRVSK